jgi:hypothetical protein
LSIDSKVRLLTLRNFFSIYLGRALDLAKDGRKDEARDWYRYFQNSEIPELLSSEGVMSDGEMEVLRSQMVVLRDSCHPSDVPEYRTDLQAIRAALERIEDKLGECSECRLKDCDLLPSQRNLCAGAFRRA